MDRRDFFKFLRDGGAALVAAVTVGIPKIEDMTLVSARHYNEYDPGSFSKLPVDNYLQTGEWIIPHVPQHKNCRCDVLDTYSLSRPGVVFTDEQKFLINSLYDSGDIVQAQRIILDELDSQLET